MSLSSTIPALRRLALGLVYLVGYTLLSPHITEDYLLSDDYEVSALSAAAAQQHQRYSVARPGPP